MSQGLTRAFRVIAADDDERASGQQMAELLQTCVALKSALDAAVTRITALEKKHDAVCRELTSVRRSYRSILA